MFFFVVLSSLLLVSVFFFFFFFFFNDTATTEIYTFPTRRSSDLKNVPPDHLCQSTSKQNGYWWSSLPRSEEHTSELQSLRHLVCRLLLEKKKKRSKKHG